MKSFTHRSTFRLTLLVGALVLVSLGYFFKAKRVSVEPTVKAQAQEQSRKAVVSKRTKNVKPNKVIMENLFNSCPG